MGKLGLISCLAIASLVSVYACTLEPNPDPDPGKNASDVQSRETPEASSARPSDDPADELLGTATDELISPDSCHVTLNFCDGAGSVGTDCTESGCSLSAAISACKSIVSSKGCALHCNAVIRNSGGTIIDTFKPQCGNTCCAEGDFCGTGGQCCDGTCKPGCPC